MPQQRWPIETTSVSGIPSEEWDRFKTRARLDKMKYRQALEMAIEGLADSIRKGDEIDWLPPRLAPSRPVKIHNDALNTVRGLSGQLSFKQNVIIGTAIHRWIKRPS